MRLKKNLPSSSIEKQFGNIVVGIDEVGRGSLAGPVVAAAVILKKHLAAIDDSKKLKGDIRSHLSIQIRENSYYNIGIASVEEIERLNILQATLLAMRRALEGLNANYDAVIIDGSILPYDNKANIYSLINGDNLSISVAAASIVAKVARDELMANLHLSHPIYNWVSNVGYGTKYHIRAIQEFGVTEHHRQSFLRKIFNQNH